MIACFTGIVLGTTTGRMGDLQQLPRWRLQLAISYNTVSGTETNPPQHTGKAYKIQTSDFFFPAAGFAFSET